MRNFIIAASFALFTMASVGSPGYETHYGQPQPGTHTVTFELGAFDISNVTHDGISFSTILFENGVNTRLKGYAELPFIHASVMLPADKNVTLEVIEGDYQEYILTEPLLPSRGVIYRNQDPASIPYWISPASMRDEWYPQNLSTHSGPFVLRDVRGTTVYVYPFRYNAVQNVLRVYTNLTVRLVENNTPVINPLPKEPAAVVREMHPVYRSLFINYPMAEDLTMGDYGDMLVIYTERDEEAIIPFVEWKREKGFNVTTQLVATGTNVKSIVQDAYDENENLLYVQLVGDWEDMKSDLLGGYAPMDPQLGCVAGEDDHPDICIGRFSATSADEVTVQVDKVINYEKSPEEAAEWYAHALGIASNQGPGDDSELDYEHIDVIYEDKLDPFTYEGFSTAYDPTGTSQMVTNALNDGVSIINYCGHGSNTSWGSTGFNNTNISQLSNENRLPVIFSVACVNGAFNSSSDCFAEAWLKKEDGGAVMTMMSTINQPWNPPMRGQDYFNDLLIGGYDYDDYTGQSGINTDEGRTTIGAITFNGLVLMCTESNGTDDWETAKTWHLFGDPSMQPRTQAPGAMSVSNNLVMSGVPFAAVITGDEEPLEGALVCISQEGVYHTAVTDATGSVTLDHTLIPGTAKLVVTAFNRETIYEEITVIPPEGAYVMVKNCEVDDAGGNNNGQADYGEAVLLNVSAENVGTDNATSIIATLLTSDPYITISDDTHDFGDIGVGEVIEGTGAFGIEIDNSAPDGHAAVLEVAFSDGGDESWISGMTIELHAPVVALGEYTITDYSGNGNGSIDPGETADLSIEVINTGSADAYNIVGEINCTDPYITIDQGSQAYGDIAAGATASQTFTVTASSETPAGYFVTFYVNVSGDLEFAATLEFSEVIGHIPVLVIDLDGNGNSADKMMEALAELEITAEYSESLPDDLSIYTSVFLCLGVFSDNHVLTSDEGQMLANYLDNGGYLYMEGADTWFYNTQTPVHPMFSIDAYHDGGSDLGTVNGIDGTFTEGMSFSYSGDNSYIDRIQAVGSAIDIFENQSPAYGTGVAYDEGTYRTIAASHEFGGLQDGASPSTKAELMNAYLEFFGFTNTLTAYFTSNTQEICAGELIEFFDLSNGDVISWEWEFEGGEPATSSVQNPQVTYPAEGIFDVTLTVTDGIDNQSITLEDYITVNTCTGVDENNFPKISLHPNPNNGIFTVEIQNVLSNFVTIKVLNTLSNVVYVEENIRVSGDFAKTINLSNLDKGLYFLVIENYQESTINRIIIR
jgi:hypothetical protein